MFIVSHGLLLIEQKIRQFFKNDPSVGLVVAAIFFEWSICRAIICLGKSSTKELRFQLEKAYGLEAYKKLWSKENSQVVPLIKVVKDWQGLTNAFKARNVLVHGRDRYTHNMAEPHFEELLTATNDVWNFCKGWGRDLSKRLPVRHKNLKR